MPDGGIFDGSMFDSDKDVAPDEEIDEIANPAEEDLSGSGDDGIDIGEESKGNTSIFGDDDAAVDETNGLMDEEIFEDDPSNDSEIY